MKNLLIFVLMLVSVSSASTYIAFVKSTDPIQYLPLNETSGLVAYDSSGNNRNGAYTASCSLAVEGFKSGERAVYLNGTNAYCDIYSATTYSAFRSDSGSLMVWVQSNGTYFGGSGGTKGIIRFYGNGNSSIQIQCEASTTRTITGLYQSTTWNGSLTSTADFSTNWHCVIITWHRPTNKFRLYIDGTRGNSKYSGIVGTWTATSFSSATLGQAANLFFQGKISHYALWNKQLTKTQIAMLSDTVRTYSITGFGDSYTAGQGATTTANRYINKLAGLLNAKIIQNSGISGTVLQNTLSMSNNGRDRFLTDLLPYESDYNVILYGLNDVRYNNATFSHDSAKADLIEITTTLVDSGIDKTKIIFGSTPWLSTYDATAPWNGGSAEKAVLYRDAIKNAALVSGAKYANIYDKTTNKTNLISVDNVHYNDTGHSFIAGIFYQAYSKSSSTTGSRKFNLRQGFSF